MDLLSDILVTLKLQGSLYFRTEFTPPWGVEVPAFENVMRFHFVHRGRCFARVAGTPDRVLLEQGDLILITRGAGHILSDPADVRPATVDEVVTASGFTGTGALTYGTSGSGHATQLVCGHFAFDRDASHPLLDALPGYLHIRDYGELAQTWLESTLRLIGAEAGRDHFGGDLVALKLSEIVLVQALRAYLASQHGDPTVLASFTDPRIRRALEAMHAEPSRAWTVESLARTAGLSRTSFAVRFSELMGMSPLAYLTMWRMQLARRMLAESRSPIIEIAERSGYGSEASFGRVFKRQFDVSPAQYRRERMQPDAAAR